MRGKVCLHCPVQPFLAQPRPVCLDIAEIFTRGQGGRQLFLQRIESRGGFLFRGRAPVAQCLVAAKQRGRNATVQLDGLYGLGNWLDQREALQLPLRWLDDPLQADKQAVPHHRNCDQ